MERKIFGIDRTGDVVTIRFIKGELMGEYVQNLARDGVDVKRVVQSIDEPGEEAYLAKKSSYSHVESLYAESIIKDDDEYYTKSEVIRKLEDILK